VGGCTALLACTELLPFSPLSLNTPTICPWVTKDGPNSDEKELFLYIIATCSNIQVIRIKEMVIKDKLPSLRADDCYFFASSYKLPCYLDKFSLPSLRADDCYFFASSYKLPCYLDKFSLLVP